VVKGKTVPLQAWSGPEGSRKLRFPDFMTTAQEGGKVASGIETATFRFVAQHLNTVPYRIIYISFLTVETCCRYRYLKVQILPPCSWTKN
jgi:hypothetical protein